MQSRLDGRRERRERIEEGEENRRAMGEWKMVGARTISRGTTRTARGRRYPGFLISAGSRRGGGGIELTINYWRPLQRGLPAAVVKHYAFHILLCYLIPHGGSSATAVISFNCRL